YEGRLHADRARADRALGLGAPEAGGSAVSEIEPNDSNAEAQRLADFGTGAGDVASVAISASIAPPAPPTPFAQLAEDDGNIDAASPTGLSSGQSVTAMGQIGDGPHGSSGTRRGDFDFFRVAGVQAGQILSIDVKTPGPQDDLDPNCALWDSAGNLLGFHEDINISSALDFDCRLVMEAPADGDYYFSIGGWASNLEDRSQQLPADPFDSSSGFSFGSEGTYTVTLGLDAVDRDCFTFGLAAGDILGTSSSGGDSSTVQVIDPSGVLRMGSTTDRSPLYPDASPMPRGGVVTSVVAVESGDYIVCIDGRPADYGADLRVFRPVAENTATRQIFFIDFDGATLDRSILGSFPGVITLSPLSSFLGNWGLGPGDEDAVIDSVLETVQENLVDDLRPLSNPSMSVQILNSRDHEDPFGQPDVSRIIIGGSIAESDLRVVSIAESIDPGNFVREETALIQLDELSASPGGIFAFYTLNGIEIAAGASKVDLVGRALGNIASHEAGYLSGVWNTERRLPGSPDTIMDGFLNARVLIDPFLRPSVIG
ncbi:MAG: hypothetical protein AAFX50_15140, partial [Acidobacteriota bacterium]